MEELEALIILNSLSYVGSIKVRFLMQHYGSAVAALRAPLEEIATFPASPPQCYKLGKKAWKSGSGNKTLI